MGKDVRGIERGKCGYCGCLPKKDAHYSSDSVDGTSAAGTSESMKERKNEAERLNACIDDALCDGGSLNGRYGIRDFTWTF